jgi:peptide chain release factor 2
MRDLKEKLTDLKDRFQKAWVLVNVGAKEQEIIQLQNQMSKPGFWDDQEQAKQVGQRLSEVEEDVAKWREFKKDLEDTIEVLELDIEDQTVNLREDLEPKILQLEKSFAQLEVQLLFTDPNDIKPAIISIYAGSGGTDAQDWAEMLLRMVLRFCEKQGWKTSITSISAGQEAGIKSVQIEVQGRYAYGHLKSENGVHRLVRISPFDAEKMRHTSFAMIEILPLLEQDVTIEVKADELRVDTFRASGHGGQSVNTTDSAVRITHVPTGLVATCQNERSQQQNKDKALAILKSKLQQYYETEIEEERQRLRGEYTEAAWGNQVRSYVLHPYQMVKDHRTGFETDQVNDVLDGNLIEFIEAYLRHVLKQSKPD